MRIFPDRQLSRLLAAMAGNQRLDGGGGVLTEAGAEDWQLGEVLAPVVLASCDLRDRWPDTTLRSPTGEALYRFERLSLAARLTAAATLHKAGDLFGPSFARPEEDKVAAALADGLGLNIHAWPRLPAALIVEALSKAAADIAAVGDAPPGAKRSLALHHLRGGLNIVGARIEGDLELYNAVLPFPVRLIGCVIDGAVIADHAQLAALDLSGTALRGISANFLKLNGSLRLRRTYCAGSMDFGGAQIGGVMDLSDSVVTPLLPQPAAVAFAGDRGAVNLSLATIDNELRFSRARIYGGLTMKGAVVKRSMFLEKALVCSPISALAKMALEVIPANTGHMALDQLKPLMATDGRVAAAIFPESPDDLPVDVWRAAEVHGMPSLTGNADAQMMMHRLLAESMRARTCALRADGAQIDGSLFARGLTTMGRLRIKYGTIQGGLHLDGSRLRSPRESFDVFDALDDWSSSATCDPAIGHDIKRFVALKDRTKNLALLQEKGRGESYALDIRETVVEGTVSLGPAMLPGDRERPSEVHGAVIASQARIGSGLQLQAVRFTGAPKDFEDKASLDIEHSTIGCDLDLRDAKGIHGIKAAFSRIAGNLLMCSLPDWGPQVQQSAFMVQPGRASGKLEFRSVEVSGDAWLVFHAVAGPALDLRQLTVTGSLNIMPMPVGDAPTTRHQRVRPVIDGASPELDDLARNHPDRATPVQIAKDDFKAINKEANLVRRGRSVRDPGGPPPPEIDLRNAKCTLFRHPPTAWPQQGALQLIGFSYQSAGEIGPLGVGRFLDSEEVSETQAPDHGAGLIKVIRIWGDRLLSLPAPAKILFGVSVFSLALFLLLESRRSDWPLLQAVDRMGLVNIGLLLGLAYFCLAMGWMSREMQPTKYQAKPMGAFWLRLQAQLPNPFRMKGKYSPTDPYLRAANALREVGKVRSAEWIELERVRARTRLLSLRHHLLARIALWLVDKLAAYGFNVARAVFAMAFIVLIGACAFEWSQTDPARAGDRYEVPPLSVVTSLETVIPLLEQRAETRPTDPDEPKPRPEPDGLMKLFAWLFRALGLLLSAVIGASLAARAESFLSRMQT